MNHKDAISVRPLPSHLSSSTYPLPSHRPSHFVTPPTPSILGYTATPFGHQDAILSTSSFSSETALAWVGDMKPLGSGKSRKRGGLRDAGADADAGKEKERAMIDELTQAFATGGDSGSISLWPTTKKNPLPAQPLAHGLYSAQSSTEGLIQTPRWIIALAALPYSDLFTSDYRNSIRAQIIGNIPIPGVIDSVQLIPPPKLFLTSIPYPLPHQTPPLPPPPHYPRFRYRYNTRIWVLMASTHSTLFPHLIVIDARSFVFSDYVHNSWNWTRASIRSMVDC
ncbi:hypothetical protein D9756_009864 [Leucocoprinus leucothites]|uniref:Uncharacterized protein n=1 Tax=Leucocoprinus leucothites TaxID=201217 RepID=A0A8H5CYA5_9AGAR|nr:hypothetical protein D9756_009864 [Leucoagaricus leucothites]